MDAEFYGSLAEPSWMEGQLVVAELSLPELECQLVELEGVVAELSLPELQCQLVELEGQLVVADPLMMSLAKLVVVVAAVAAAEHDPRAPAVQLLVELPSVFPA